MIAHNIFDGSTFFVCMIDRLPSHKVWSFRLYALLRVITDPEKCGLDTDDNYTSSDREPGKEGGEENETYLDVPSAISRQPNAQKVSLTIPPSTIPCEVRSIIL